MTCRPDRLRPGLPGPFRPLAVAQPVVVAKRKHGDRVDRWRWAGELVGTAGSGWKVVRHYRDRDVRAGADDVEDPPDSAITFRWLGTHAPATIVVKLDDAATIIEVKIDAALPVRMRGSRLLFVDLDVDVLRDAAGTVFVRDWDVFEVRAAELGYTDATREVARAGEAFGFRLLAAWETTLEADVARIVAASRTMVDGFAGRARHGPGDPPPDGPGGPGSGPVA